MRGLPGEVSSVSSVQSVYVDELVNWAATFVLIVVSIPSPHHSYIPCLKPSFSANPSHRSLPFLLQD